MAAPGFGFSFGDFVQAISILNDVRKALRDTGGAKDELKSVSVDLEQLEILFEQLDRGSWDHGGDAGHINAVKGMALTCKAPLQEFLAKLEKFKKLKETNLRGFRAGVRGEARKMRWAVEMKDEVEKFKTVIVAKLTPITLLMLLNTFSGISKTDMRIRTIQDSIALEKAQREELKDSIDRARSEIRETNPAQLAVNQNASRLVQICTGTRVDVEDFRRLVKVQHNDIKQLLQRISCRQNQGIEVMFQTSQQVVLHVTRLESIVGQLVRLFGSFSVAALRMLQQILRSNLEIYALLHQVLNSIPRGPMLAIQDSIHFTDALGRTHYLPYQWFKDWDVFESMLKCKFRNFPGEKRVLRGEYHILEANRRGFNIDPQKWESLVFPGSDIDMSMVIRGNIFSEGLCPRPGCGQDNPPEKVGGFFTCSACRLKYRSFSSLKDPGLISEDASDFPQLQQTQQLTRNENKTSSNVSITLSRMGDVDVIEELNAFKMIQITTEVDPGKLWWEIDGEDLNISLESLEKMASAWSLSRVSAWISRNAYPADFVQAFQELRIEKMTFCVLAADTRVLRKRLIQNFEEGRVPSRIRLLTMSGYEQSIDRELARLSQTIKSLMKSKFQEPELGLEIPQVGRQKPIRFKDAMAGNLVSPSTPVRLGVE